MKRELTYPQVRAILALRRKGLSLRVITDMFDRCQARQEPSMRVLVACEFSGVVRDAFILAGHDATSVDLLESESSLGRHIRGDVLGVLLRETWDLMIAHPPCTHLAVSGARWFKDKRKEQAEALDYAHAALTAETPVKFGSEG